MSTIIPFLIQLQKNNNKTWFETHKTDFLEARKELLGHVENLISKIADFDPSVTAVQAKDCMFRIYRDVRFSNDKTPYKNHFGAYICDQGKKSSGPGYYIHIQPQHSFIGGGIYMPEPESLAKIRQEIDYNGEKIRKILEKPSFKKYFPNLWEEGKLSRPPKGYESDNPSIELLKLKSFAVTCPIADEKVENGKWVDSALLAFKEQIALHQFLKEAIS